DAASGAAGSAGASTTSAAGGSGGATGGNASGGAAGNTVDGSADRGAGGDTGGLGGAAAKPDAQSGGGGAAPDTGATNDASSDTSASSDASADMSAPKSCKGPPTCGAATSDTSCAKIRGCSWSQCAFRTPGLGVACGAEGPDRAGNCPPGCHLMTNCVGANGDYYGSPDDCGAASRQTENACVGVGSVWQMCSWFPSVTCVGKPVRTDCTGIMDATICVEEGCSWQ